MTKLSKFGTAAKLKRAKKEKEDIQSRTSGSDISYTQDGDTYHGKDIETVSDIRLENHGQGKKVILRQFTFQLPEKRVGDPDVSGDELLNFHRSKVVAYLWKDELDMILEPKLHFAKDNKSFTIYATCTARVGSTILEKPKFIQEIIHA